jgi:Cu+-exporting ATPase
MEKDPVCDMDVTPETAAGKSEYQGKTYYFCGLGCKHAFDKDPSKFVSKVQGDANQDKPKTRAA